MAKIDKKSYNDGVKDALRMFFQHINSMEHATGFANSQLAQDHIDIMKSVYSNMSTLIK